MFENPKSARHGEIDGRACDVYRLVRGMYSACGKKGWVRLFCGGKRNLVRDKLEGKRKRKGKGGVVGEGGAVGELLVL